MISNVRQDPPKILLGTYFNYRVHLERPKKSKFVMVQPAESVSTEWQLWENLSSDDVEPDPSMPQDSSPH